ncbi:cell division topological specificity factor MinE [Helicobacter sp. CLO-3]|uniref:cell division topological specificity factor MinE n=1 Tax=unclassified Helicobacter TaxID=2593540 RepID=UPI0008057B74|nr:MULTISPECIES: cell division topological specificity factor MinE [unclassified Helicobacter]OBV29863.1 cell division topological specificity factor MinE [Helicobacter sp. CLO-3]OHU84057.1 cell division topological specificity factor MinE [Helicobacter sp. CLO-3]
MSWRDMFSKKNSAQTAADRLTLVLAHERSVKIPYMDDMKREIIEVVRKYTQSDNISVRPNSDSNQDISTLEIEITLG